MAVEKWPTQLPRPDRNGYDQQGGDPRQRFTPEEGMPVYGLRYSRTFDPVSMVLKLDANGKARLERFWRQTLKLGSRAFTMPGPDEDGWPLLVDGVPLLVKGEPLLISRYWLCTFVQVPGYQPLGNQWRAAFTVARIR